MYRWQMELDSISRLHVMPGWNMELYGCREYIKHM